MEPLPHNPPDRPTQLSYELPHRPATLAERHRVWAQATRKFTARARKWVLIGFGGVWLLAAVLLKTRTVPQRSTAHDMLMLILLGLAACYLMLVAIGAAYRPLAIVRRLIAFSLIALGWAVIVDSVVDVAKSGALMYNAYGFPGLDPSHRLSLIRFNPCQMFFGIALLTLGILSHVAQSRPPETT